MGKLLIQTALPTNNVTRDQLIASIESMQAVDGEFTDGVQIVISGGKIKVGAILQSQVTDLTADLANKQPTDALWTNLLATSGSTGVFKVATDKGITLLPSSTLGESLFNLSAGTAVADVIDAVLPGSTEISDLTFSATPTQAECEALRDQCQDLRDVLAESIITIEALRDRLKTTGGNGILAD